MITLAIVDDEPLAREAIKQLLVERKDITVVAEAANAVEALKVVHQHQPDVLFLDIQMPKITGLELAAMLDDSAMPHIVFITAFDQYAVQAFEDNAFDYLLKPVSKERLNKTLDRLHHELDNKAVPAQLLPQSLQLIPCFQLNRIQLLNAEQIEYAYSDVGGVHVFANGKEVHTQLTLKVLADKTTLLHCHRQWLVNPANISEIELQENGSATIFTTNGAKLPASRRHLKQLKHLLGLG